MAAITPPWVIQASSHPADVFRRQSRLLALGNQGIKAAGDLAVTANGTPNMSVNVAAGEALINGTQNTVSQGAYTVLNDATVNLAIAASDPTNPRIDIVVAQVRDAAYSGANNDWILAVVTGTPAPSPSPPATPANAIVLANVAVAANATSIVSGNITDKRVRLGPPYKARAYNNAAQTIGLNVWTKIQCNTIAWDPNGNFDAVTNFQYTAPVPGFYQVNGQVRINAPGANVTVGTAIGVNGSQVSFGVIAQVTGTSSALASAVADIVKVNAGDTIALFANPNANSNTQVDTAGQDDYLSIHFLSQ